MQSKRILLLGSGLMAETVIQYLLKRPENKIVIASNILEEAQKLAQGKPNCEAKLVNVTDPSSLSPLVANSDIVISYVPWTFHLHVAKVCLKEKKNLVTASYIQNNMAELHSEVAQAGLTFLNEVGLDPGIDHIATMKVVDECAEAGEKIIEYESFCGGLPSPEFCDNPLGYKFSWSPVGALLSLKNDAVYISEGKNKFIQSDDLLFSAEKKDISMALSLEGYPNRDSSKYKDLYRLHDCQKLIRGTLRYYGFSIILNSMKSLNLLDTKQKPKYNETWVQLLQRQVSEVNQVNQQAMEVAAENGVGEEVELLAAKIITLSLSNSNYPKMSKRIYKEKGRIIFDAYMKLGFFKSANGVSTGRTFIENLVDILSIKCALRDGETDMIVMQHNFKIQRKDGRFYHKKSKLIVIGQKNDFSAMAITVGTPTAVATQLILDNKITRKGVLMPNYKDIYYPIFQELEKLGLSCIEEDDNIAPPVTPKL